MSLFSNIKSDNNNHIQFELNNNNLVKLSLANAIRRTIIAEIPTFSIDTDSVIFKENSSMLHDAILLKRLALIPLNVYTINSVPIENIDITLNKTNNTEYMMSITTGDFSITNNGQEIDKVIVSDKILFAKLKPNQSLNFEAKLNKNTSLLGGAYYSPVSKSVLTFKQDQKQIDIITKDLENKELFIRAEGEKYYLKNKNGDPDVYVLNIESNDELNAKDIVSLALKVLKEKLQIIIDATKNNIENKIKIQESKKLFESFDFIIQDEDYTLGNLINSYLLDHPQIKYSGYLNTHPTKKEIVITTQLKSSNNIDANKKIFIETADNIIKLIEKLEKEWEASKHNTGPKTRKIKIKK